MNKFMQEQIASGPFVQVECGNCDYKLVPKEDAADWNKNGCPTVETYPSGYFCRLSAPGYLDCTDWNGPFDTVQEARDYLIEMYGDDDEG